MSIKSISEKTEKNNWENSWGEPGGSWCFRVCTVIGIWQDAQAHNTNKDTEKERDQIRSQDGFWLVVLTILKKLVNGKDYPIYFMDNKKYLKPPTRILYTVIIPLQSWSFTNLQGPSPRISTAFLSHPLFPRAFAGPIRREAWVLEEQPIILEDNRCISAVFGPYKLNTIRLYPAPFLEHSGTTKKTTTNRKDVDGLFWNGITGCPRSKINPKRGDLPGHLLLKPALTSKMSKNEKLACSKKDRLNISNNV
jgi:hypothetical protein